MTPPDELPLRDIVLPPDIGVWPLAPGWWVLIALVAAGLVLVGLHRLWRHRTRLRRLGLIRLTEIVAACPLGTDDHRLAEGLSMLCRQLALAYPGGRAAATLTGAAWASHLDGLVPKSRFFAEGEGSRLLEAAFRADATLARAALTTGLEAWIGALPPLPVRWQLRDV
jgi:hypothetical protein